MYLKPFKNFTYSVVSENKHEIKRENKHENKHEILEGRFRTFELFAFQQKDN